MGPFRLRSGLSTERQRAQGFLEAPLSAKGQCTGREVLLRIRARVVGN